MSASQGRVTGSRDERDLEGMFQHATVTMRS